MKNMLPSQRPERGGTSRGQGYWEQMEKEGKTRPRRRVTDSQYSVGDVSVDSEHITRWNVPKDLSEDGPRVLPKTPPPLEPKQQRRVVASSLRTPTSPVDKLLPGSWRWSPQKGSEDDFSVTKLGGVLQRDNGDNDKGSPSGGGGPPEPCLGTAAKTAPNGKQPLSHEMLRARSKARRLQRQSLKESGDYLGVQGVNPHTGEPDALSPTDSSAASIISHQETVHSVMSTWRDMWKHNRHHKPKGPPGHDEHVRGNDAALSRSQKGKQKVRDLGKAVRWKRREWSSLQEPALSPIAQSVKSASPSSREYSFCLSPLFRRLLIMVIEKGDRLMLNVRLWLFSNHQMWLLGSRCWVSLLLMPNLSQQKHLAITRLRTRRPAPLPPAAHPLRQSSEHLVGRAWQIRPLVFRSLKEVDLALTTRPYKRARRLTANPRR
jgi:hypothetical protein